MLSATCAADQHMRSDQRRERRVGRDVLERRREIDARRRERRNEAERDAGHERARRS